MTSFLEHRGWIHAKNQKRGLSTSALNEQISSVKGLGACLICAELNMSSCLCAELRRPWAFRFQKRRHVRDVNANFNFFFSFDAMFLGTTTAESASSISRHPGGSTEQTRRFRRSSRWAPLCSSSPSTAAKRTHLCTAQKDDRPRLLRVTMLQFRRNFSNFTESANKVSLWIRRRREPRVDDNDDSLRSNLMRVSAY